MTCTECGACFDPHDHTYGFLCDECGPKPGKLLTTDRMDYEPGMPAWIELNERLQKNCHHSWRFDGDDPYIICIHCGIRRSAL